MWYSLSLTTLINKHSTEYNFFMELYLHLFIIILRLQFQILVSCIAVVPTRRMAGWSSITIKVCTTKNKCDTRSTITWNSKVCSAVYHLYHYPCKHIYMKWFFSIYDIKGGEFVNQAIESKLSSLLPLQLLMSMQIKRKEQQSCNKPCQLEYLLQSHSSASSRRYISNSGKSWQILWNLPSCHWGANTTAYSLFSNIAALW